MTGGEPRARGEQAWNPAATLAGAFWGRFDVSASCLPRCATQVLGLKCNPSTTPPSPLLLLSCCCRLHNPLQRMERLCTSWFGVITDYEGVIVEDTTEYHALSWIHVADEFNLLRPLGHALQRIKGIRDEVVSVCTAECAFVCSGSAGLVELRNYARRFDEASSSIGWTGATLSSGVACRMGKVDNLKACNSSYARSLGVLRCTNHAMLLHAHLLACR
jgi:hypothetical protein